MSHDPQCEFCRRIDTGDYDKTNFYGVVSFEPLRPVVEGHRLFVPVHHIDSAAADPIVAGHTFAAAAAYVHSAGINANIITSVGRHATQTVFHCHIHVVPRRRQDRILLPWTNQAEMLENGTWDDRGQPMGTCQACLRDNR